MGDGSVQFRGVFSHKLPDFVLDLSDRGWTFGVLRGQSLTILLLNVQYLFMQFALLVYAGQERTQAH